jgi:hypothetical protein
MGNSIKYTTGTEANSLVKGNFRIGTGDVGKGPSSSTGFYKATAPPEGGYRIYLNNENVSGNIAYHTAANDSELISFTNSIAGQSYTTINQCFSYYTTQNDKFCINAEYAPVITDGLIFFNDYGFIPSYPKNGTSVYDLGPSQNTGTVKNSPTFSTTRGGEFNFGGTGANLGNFTTTKRIDHGTDAGIQSLNNSDFTIDTWVREINTTSVYNLGLIYQCGFDNATTPSSYIVLGRSDANNIIVELSNVETVNGALDITSGVLLNAPLSNSYMRSKGWANLTAVLKKINGYYTPYLYLDGAIVNDTLYYIYNPADTNQYIQFTPPALSGVTSYNFSNNNKNVFVGTFFNAVYNGLSWLGEISSVKVYNRALSEVEIIKNFNSIKSRYGIT